MVRADRRLRIEHAQHLRPDDISRFAKLHVIASVQPYHAIDDGRWAETRIGHQRACDNVRVPFITGCRRHASARHRLVCCADEPDGDDLCGDDAAHA